MRFTSNARPSLTPLGHRLLHLSESKLNQLEPALGGRDTATLLRKGVLVREAVKSAWRSVDEGVQAEMNDWSHKAAMGLDVIGEDDEEEGECEDEQEGRWFEELVSSFGEDDFGAGSGAYVHEWADANVASAFDDVEYDEDDMEAYTLPSSPSPTVTTIAIPASPQPLALDFDVLPALEAIPTEVEILEVMDDEEDYETDSESELHYHFGSRSAHLTWPEPQPLQPIIEPLAVPRALPLAPHPTPLTPVSPFTLDYSDDLDECADSFLLPPPLVRSFSSDSTSSMREDDEDDACVTPPQYSCEELEEEAPNPATKVEDGYAMTKRALSGMGSWLGLQLDDDSEGVFA